MKGIVFKLRKGKHSVIYINNLFKKCNKDGKVYFSSNIPIVNGTYFNEIMFCVKYGGINRFVVADIEKFVNFPSKGIPSDCSQFFPDGYCADCSNWFLISNMREVLSCYLSGLIIVDIDGNTKEFSESVANSKFSRLNYISKSDYDNDSDVLLK